MLKTDGTRGLLNRVTDVTIGPVKFPSLLEHSRDFLLRQNAIQSTDAVFES